MMITTMKDNINRMIIRDYHDRTMPESPTEIKPPSHSSMSTSPVSAMPTLQPHIGRPLSAGSSISGYNGAVSPHSSLSGRTPSPPGFGSTGSAQQLPPACGARQLSKLKRFLTTLIQFGSDISPDSGDRVRGLVLAVVNNHLSIEEFHAKLQEATNFPLRPFVIPFLKANLPLLQRELLHCARMAKQSPQQYLAHNEHMLFESAHSPVSSHDMSFGEQNENGKRHSLDTTRDTDAESESNHPAKRPHIAPSPAIDSRNSTPAPPPVNPPASPARPDTTTPVNMPQLSSNTTRVSPTPEKCDTSVEDKRVGTPASEISLCGSPAPTPKVIVGSTSQPKEPGDEEWHHVDSVLRNISDLVGRCQFSLSALKDSTKLDREELSMLMRQGGKPDDTKRVEWLANEKVTDVRRQAEEAVNEVKRQAVLELQKAVAAAETKAADLVTVEKRKMEAAVMEIKKKAKDEAFALVNKQEDSRENCWNCGRKATETCSGCNVARYCGSFCQHKNWETHHRICAQTMAAHAARNQSNDKQSSSRGNADKNEKMAPPVNTRPSDSRSPEVKGEGHPKSDTSEGQSSK